MESDRPFREWPLEQLAEQAMLHRVDAQVPAGLAAEAARRPGVRAKALHARIRQLQDGATPMAGAGVPVPRSVTLVAFRGCACAASSGFSKRAAAVVDAATLPRKVRRFIGILDLESAANVCPNAVRKPAPPGSRPRIASTSRPHHRGHDDRWP